MTTESILNSGSPRMALSTSMPSMRGILMSSNTTAGFPPLAVFIFSFPAQIVHRLHAVFHHGHMVDQVVLGQDFQGQLDILVRYYFNKFVELFSFNDLPFTFICPYYFVPAGVLARPLFLLSDGARPCSRSDEPLLGLFRLPPRQEHLFFITSL